MREHLNIQSEIFKILNDEYPEFKRKINISDYAVPTVSSSTIRIDRHANSNLLHFKLNSGITGNIKISVIGESTNNYKVYDIYGEEVTTLSSGYYDSLICDGYFVILNKEGLSESTLANYNLIGEVIDNMLNSNNIIINGGKFDGILKDSVTEDKLSPGLRRKVNNPLNNISEGSINESKLSSEVRLELSKIPELSNLISELDNDLKLLAIKNKTVFNIDEFERYVIKNGNNRSDWDWTEAFKQAGITAAQIGATVELNKYHTYLVKDSFIPTGNYKTNIHWKGNLSTIRFDNSVINKPLINLSPITTMSTFENIIFTEVNKRTSMAVRISAYPQTGGQPNWKNRFIGCQFYEFKTGVSFTTDGNVLVNTSQDWACENLFLHCKFKNCELSVLNQNLQALNNTFIQTDLENDLAEEQFTLIRDESGGGMYFYGGSLIGRGRVYEWINPNNSSGLWVSGHIIINSCRFEVRNGHIGQLFYQDPSGNYSQFNRGSIKVTDCKFIAYNQNIDLLHYSGKVIADFNNLDISNGYFKIRNFPVQGISANLTTGTSGSVNVRNCTNVEFVLDTTSNKYGNTNSRFKNKVVIENLTMDTNGSYVTDSHGFHRLQFTPVNSISYGLNELNVKKIIFNETQSSAGFKDIKFILPNGARPLKFGFFKEPVRLTSNCKYSLYVIKDNQFWQNPSSLNLSTDGILVSTIGDTTNSSGLFESNIVLNSNLLGNQFSSGNSTMWTEGRMLAKYNDAVTFSTGGFIYVEYM